ncbi:MAG: DsbA family protein [Henriciella sp.]|uniref:DsbA family protein n=1 Tax=Henriciella sp. TaxID=1968823 RepID=UPI0032EDFB44
MRAISRRAVLIVGSLLAITACGSADEAGTSGSASTDSAAVNEMVLGSEDAPVTVIEYASWTCPACLQFQNDVVGKLKEDYVETGKVKFIFREYPTPPANIAVAGFAIARCAGEDQYFDVLDELFDRQRGILSLAREGGQVKAALQQVAANHGITDTETFDACLQDSGIRRAIAASVSQGENDGVEGTPTVLLNGEVLPGYDWRRWDGMQAVLNEALGEDAPATEPAATDTPEAAEAAPDADTEGESGDTDMVEPTSGEAEPQ